MSSAFSSSKQAFKEILTNNYKKEGISDVEKSWASIDINDADKRNILDGVLKDVVLDISQTIEDVQKLVTYAISLGKGDFCSTSTPIVLLSDIFDIYTITECETLFTFVEKNVSVWKDELFFSACKNNLLRMCNDLLRRLSRSQNTIFRGRILLFLASFFPFSERSGLNLVSEFNLEANEYKKDETIEDEAMETVGNESTALRIDYNLYNKFLTLQDFLRNPSQCYNTLRWPAFVLSWTDTFSMFQNMKLDKISRSRKSAREHLGDNEEGSVFFAKYLTNPRLLQLQISDSNFRRSLIIQGLICLQYLSSQVKSKVDSKLELRSVQQDWVKENEANLYSLLGETPRGSERFRDMVRHMLTREHLWNNWKNEGCPEFKKPGTMEETDERRFKPYPKRKNLGDHLKYAKNNSRYYLGNPEMSRLWNLSPNNLEACKTQERAFLPSLDQYMSEAIAQMDPAAGIEPEYKKVNDPNFGWRALRLLAQKSTCFFHSNNAKTISHLPVFIESSLQMLRKEHPSFASEEIEVEAEDDAKEVNLPVPRDEVKLSEEAIDGIAQRLGEDWLKLAAKLGTKDSKNAHELLRNWITEDEDATPENMAYLLEGLKLHDAADYLKMNFCKGD